MKGQGAMEYLMTYGWAILIVIIVGIVLWQSGVFGTQSSGISGFNGGIAVTDASVGTDDQLSVYLQNVAGETLKNVNISSTDCAALSTFTLATGKSTTKTLNCSTSNICGAQNDGYSVDLTITYTTTTSGLTKTETGTINGICGA